MSIARHHAEWLSLVDQSGPFLSVPVLLRAFPQGLDKLESSITSDLRLAYEEWLQDQHDLAIHTAWVRHVLTSLLEFPAEILKEGQSLPPGLSAPVSEHSETLRPDLAIIHSNGQPDDAKPQLLIQVFQPSQRLESAVVGKQWKASPATRMMELLHATDIPLGLVTNGEQWMLVYGPKNETTGYASWYSALWMEEPSTLRAFASLLAVRRFFGVADSDTLLALLDESSKNQQEVTDQLGLQVRQAVEVLVQSFDRLDQDSGRTLLKGIDERKLYEASLTVMMRLVFLFSAEERKLMPIDEYALYAQYYAVSNMGAQLRETADKHGEEILERSFDSWSRLLATFRAVYAGVEHDAMRLPPYGGNLFDPDRFKFLEGRPSHGTWRDTIAEPPRIDNRTVLHLLEALQWLEVRLPGGGSKEKRRLSFRALDIEQIGHVYEGLLDHTAVRTSEPVLGLAGAKGEEPEISLSALEKHHKKSIDALVEFLKEETGRSEKALRKCISEPGIIDEAKLRVACRNDAKLMARVRPYASLVREDTFGYPVVITEGSVYVTSGTDRRSSGTHYTPRSLTEPIVQHTLEPLVYIGPAEGKPKEEWKLKTAKDLLDLKVCDMAMGSGAFLVQACRYLSERLLEAWEEAQRSLGGSLQITPEGERAKGVPEERLVPADEDERRAIAMRIVAERCLYGVDKNPLAVEMAKLSLWLITLSKGKPFTFLNHALKCGDSLVGADEKMFLEWAHGGNKHQITTFDARLEEVLNDARAKRRELESFEAKDVRDAERKADLLDEAELAMEWVKLGCNLLVGAKLLELSDKDSELQLGRLLSDYLDNRPLTSMEAVRALGLADKVRAFHWPFEFPEVFETGGFDAFVGNPPFLGGVRVSEILGIYYNDYLVASYPPSTKKADHCIYFLRRAAELLRREGASGYLTTKTAAQGKSRSAGLDYLIGNGMRIYRAQSSFTWPGSANVLVMIVHALKGKFDGAAILDGKNVDFISGGLLSSEESEAKPKELFSSADMAFQGSSLLGQGFIISREIAEAMVGADHRNKEVIFPYLRGEEVNRLPELEPQAYAINFFEMEQAEAERFVLPFRHVEEHVRPERIGKDVRLYPRLVNQWWKYWHSRQALYRQIAGHEQIVVCARVTKRPMFRFAPANWVYNDKIIAIARSTYEEFAVLQSSVHEEWAWKYGSTLKADLNYVAKECHGTFPFPQSLALLRAIGCEYYRHRQYLMKQYQYGLTRFYNELHDQHNQSADFVQARVLRQELNQLVVRAYGWTDLDTTHLFQQGRRGEEFTISAKVRHNILERLLALNNEQYGQELKLGLHEQTIEKPIDTRGKRKKGVGNGELFG